VITKNKKSCPQGVILPRANVAQSVEQLTRNEQVSGSIPLIGSTFSIKTSVSWLDMSFGVFLAYLGQARFSANNASNSLKS
jgi:hypothetical protein